MDRRAWDDRYSTDALVWKADPNRFLVEQAAGIPPGRALDFACGEGRNAVWLAEQGWTVTAVDFSTVGIMKGRRLATERGVEVEFIEADVVEWTPPARAFDLVVVMYLHLPADERRRAFGHAADAVAPGGVLLVVGHDPANLIEGIGGPQDPGVLAGAEEIAAALAGLEIAEAGQVRRVVETEAGDRTAIDVLVRAQRASAA